MLKCHTNISKPVQWIFIPLSSPSYYVHSIQFPVYSERHISDFFSNVIDIDVDETTGDYDLVIKNVTHYSTGSYVCIEEDGIGATHERQLLFNSLCPFWSACECGALLLNDCS